MNLTKGTVVAPCLMALFLFLTSAYTAEAMAETPEFQYLFHLRAGLTTNHQDAFINSDWGHKMAQSPLVTTAIFMRRSANQPFRIMPGLGFSFIRSLEALESVNGKANIESKYYAFQILGLFEFQPVSFGDFGLNALVLGDMAGQRDVELRADGLQKTLSSESTFPAISVSVGGHYQWTQNTRLNLNIERRPLIRATNFASPTLVNGLSLGIDYAF